MIDNDYKPIENDWTTLLRSLETINENSVGLVVTATEPTAATVPPGKVVIYDNATTRRVYFRTGKDSVGYITMTMI